MSLKAGDIIRVSGTGCGLSGQDCRVLEVRNDGAVRYETLDGADSCTAGITEQAPECNDHILTLVSKGDNNMSEISNVVEKLELLGLAEPDRLLRRYNIVDELGRLTEDGKEVLWRRLLDNNKASLVADLQKLEAAAKTEVKKGKK
jgi:hypothetical protein